MINLTAIDFSEYNPKKTIIIISVFVGKMPPSHIKTYLEQVRNSVSPMFNDLGFRHILFHPVTTEMAELGISGTKFNTTTVDDSDCQLSVFDEEGETTFVEMSFDVNIVGQTD